MHIHGNTASQRPAYTPVTLYDVTENHTPLRPVRVEASLWEEFGRLVGKRNRSAVIRDFIRWYVGERGAKLPKRPLQPSSQAEPSETSTIADLMKASEDSPES